MKKLLRFFVLFSCVLGLVLFSARPALNQTGNGSLNSFPILNELFRNSTTPVRGIVINRNAFESALANADFRSAIALFEEKGAVEFSDYYSTAIYGTPPTLEEISGILGDLAGTVGTRATVLYIAATANGIELFAITPPAPTANLPVSVASTAVLPLAQLQPTQNGSSLGVHERVADASLPLLQATVKQFREAVSDPRSKPADYLVSGRQLYDWLVAPLEPALKASQSDTLVLVPDTGLRSLPFAALYDGKQFLIEKYKLSVLPSFGLADTRYEDIRQAQVLTMGASQFPEQEQKVPLPAVPVELAFINQLYRPSSTLPAVGGPALPVDPVTTSRLWPDQVFLNEKFTVANLKGAEVRQRSGIIHLATHGEFKPGNVRNSYIQFWDSRLTLDQLQPLARELGWKSGNNPELLVLSACKTAIGDRNAELGFTGLAIATGIKSALGSLWAVSDAGTLSLMSEFYNSLKESPIRSESLRQAQLAMLKNRVTLQEKQIKLSDQRVIPLPAELSNQTDLNLSHPYYWSAFTLIGNWN